MRKRLLKFINSILKFVGFFLIKEHKLRSLISIRDAFARKSLSNNQSHRVFHNEISGVVFSCDRPGQLYIFLTSYFKFSRGDVPSLAVIIKTSNSDFKIGYEKLISIFSCNPKVVFIYENISFKHTLLCLISDLDCRRIFFNVDDMVYIRPIDWDKVCNEVNSIYDIFSIRLGVRIDFSYTANRFIGTPSPFEIKTPVMVYNWGDKPCEWSDPLSVDGNIYMASTICPLIEVLDFQAPNSLESGLKEFSFLFDGERFSTFENPSVVNVVLNRVQNEVTNRSPDISPEYLLKKWIQGEVVDMTSMPRNSTHVELPEVRFTRISEALY